MQSYTKVTITTDKPGEKDLLIALLSELNYEGFEENGMTLHAFIPAGSYDQESLKQVVGQQGFSWETSSIEPVNWNEEWEKNFQPVLVNQFCCIRAAFHAAVPGVQYDIIITPKMSFGTGHHATTYLMVEEMEKLKFDNARVLDFGTGTGVLAILAEKLGADGILAIDNDAWSIENAIENVRENNCHRVLVKEASDLTGSGGYDIILANINRNVLLAQMHEIAQHLAAEGVVIMSGLLTGDREMIEVEAAAAALKFQGLKERDGWISLRFSH